MLALSAHTVWLGVRDMLWSDAIVGGALGAALVAITAVLAAHAIWRHRSHGPGKPHS